MGVGICELIERMPGILRRLGGLLLVAVVCAGVPVTGWADISDGVRPGGGKKKEKPAPRAPVAKDVTVRVVRGRTTEIVLEGITGTGSAMDFSIRTLPRIGVLQPAVPVAAGPSKAVVRYTAAPGTSGERDVFTYGVQIPGRPSSTSATVTVLISDPRAKLVCAGAVDAGVVVAGETVVRPLTIRNTGDGVWEGGPELPAGWSWRTPAGGAFSLEPGGVIEAELECQPAVPGLQDETVVLDGATRLRLTARAIAPFTAFPSTLVLDWEEASMKRSGKVQLQNNTKAGLEVMIDGPKEFGVVERVTVPADGKVEVLVSAVTALDLEGKGMVQFSGGGHRHAVTVESRVAPAVVRVKGGAAAVVDFGKVAVSEAGRAEQRVELENAGGSQATVSVEGLQAFVVSGLGEKGTVVVKPGGVVTLGLKVRESRAGIYEEKMVVVSGTARLEVPVRVETTGEAAGGTGNAADRTLENTSTRPVVSAVPRNNEERAAHAQLAVGGLLAADGTERAELPRINLVDYVSDDGYAVTFAWDLPEGEGWTFRILRPEVGRSKLTGQFARIWVPAGKEAVIRIEGRRAIATVTGLVPGDPFKCALQTIAADGRKSLPGDQLTFHPLLPAPVPWLRYVVGVLAAVAVVVWGWKKWREPIRAQGV
jgi:hypothetical protein